jgi:FkbM family methyltransferase
MTEPQAVAFSLEYVIAHLMLARPSVFFIQIGANDGMTTDPLYKFVTQYNWEGILVEPIPEIFQMLKTNYKQQQKNLKFLNMALGERDELRTLYTIRTDANSFQKADIYSSFYKESVLAQTEWIPDVANRIVERQVRCISIDTLLNEAAGREIDLLLMDTEGYDFAILKMIDFVRLRPAVICYEHVFMSKAQHEEAASLLFGQGYRVTRGNLDTIAYRPRQIFGWARHPSSERGGDLDSLSSRSMSATNSPP